MFIISDNDGIVTESDDLDECVGTLIDWFKSDEALYLFGNTERFAAITHLENITEYDLPVTVSGFQIVDTSILEV